MLCDLYYMHLYVCVCMYIYKECEYDRDGEEREDGIGMRADERGYDRALTAHLRRKVVELQR